ncbi:MAG: SDR family NAD(P)-dependent oxidoreductase, partial [Dysgonamonadaceae bacterium]|jgi:short-subunit dehydrogenase|nr:SDR family NAD(P)-dependent oxidoreductase [Dysgonamonadaceae bacterium]
VERLAELEQLGVKTAKLDVADNHSVAEFVEKILAQEKRIDALINNAGYGEYGAVEDVDIENAKKQIDVNLFGTARMIKSVLPIMRKQNSGTIINITSIGGKIATPLGGWYYASKFALEALSDSLRNEVRQFGIKVVVVEPGGIKTEWGGIATETGMAASGNTAYSALTQTFAKTDSLQDKLPPATIIAKLIKKILEKKNPKTRYVKGFMAKPILFFNKWLPDSMLDKIIINLFK